MRKRWIALIVVASVLVVLVAGLYWAGRSLFHMPTAKGVDSVIGEVGGERVLGVFAHPDDEQTVNGLFWRAKQRDGAYTAMITATAGEAGHQVPVVARQEDLGVVRTAEALKNSFNLGVDEHEVWDYPDGGVPEADALASAEWPFPVEALHHAIGRGYAQLPPARRQLPLA